MTYLGTRPILQDELQKYELHHRARIAIKPGITGMWQVSGRSDINLLKYDYGFFLDWGKEEDAYKNEHQVFTWHNGTLLRHYLDHGKIKDEEYMYLHYWCRPTTFAIKEYDEQKDYLIYADTTTDKPFELIPELILKRSRRSKVKYYAKVLWFNRKKITWERIVFNVKGMLNYKK